MWLHGTGSSLVVGRHRCGYGGPTPTGGAIGRIHLFKMHQSFGSQWSSGRPTTMTATTIATFTIVPTVIRKWGRSRSRRIRTGCVVVVTIASEWS
jgi:hypothetical protein